MSKQRFVQRVVNFTVNELNNASRGGCITVTGSIFTQWCRDNSDVIETAYNEWKKSGELLAAVPRIHNVVNNLAKPDRWVLETNKEILERISEENLEEVY